MHKHHLMIALLAVAMPTIAQADPIIPNSSFELGNTGFTSGYTYNTDLVPSGRYYVDTGSSIHNSFWTTNVTAHTGSEYMIINGNQTLGVPVYDASNIAVLANTQYFFSAWITSLAPQSPAVLQFSINGTAVNAPLTISSTVGLWQQIYVPWFSGAATLADISLLNANLAYMGNDFGLDDIALSTTQPTSVPEPLTLSLFAAGLAGVGLLRRRKRA